MKTFALVTAACALLPTPLLAFEASDDATIVVTATGSEASRDQSGQAITVIEREAIERLQPSTLADLLARTPGITVSSTGPIGGFTAVRIRGAEGEQTLTLIDGVRVNDPSSPGGGFDFGNLLVGNIDRVEVLRGPNSVPWGSQSIGGVVNITTARPGKAGGGSARAENGSNDRLSVVGQYGIATGPVTASLGGGYFTDDGISAAASGTEPDGYRQYAANGRVEVALSEAVSLDLRGYYFDGKADLDGFPPPFFSLADTPEYSTAQQLLGYAGIRADFGRLKNRLAFTLSDVNRDNFANPAAIAPDFFSRGRSERFEYRGDWSLNETIRAVVGAEHERSRFNDGFLDTGVNVTSGYVQLVLNPFSRLTLTGGVRLDDHETWGSDTTFSANAAWRPTDNLVVRAAYGEGFKAPTLYQLYSFYGDPTLKPERAQSWEVGVEQWLLDRRVRLGLTGWQRRTRSQIDFDLFFFRYNNIARSRGKGIEAEIELRPTDRFSLSAIYSYSDSEGRQDNEATYHRLLRRPVHSLNLAMDWNAYGKVKLGADVKLVGDSIDGFGGSERLDGFALAAVRASAPLGHGLELYGRVENIFDTTYQTVAGYKAYGRNAHIGVRMKF